MFSGLSFFAFYMIPTWIAWYRKKQGQPISGSLVRIAAMNFFLGIFIVGWVIAICDAFNFNVVAWAALRLVKVLPQTGGAMPQGPTGDAGASGATCGMCGGTGSMTCSSCGGKGSWYDPPQGASGTAQLRTCTMCVSSGRLRCTYCGGSGRRA